MPWVIVTWTYFHAVGPEVACDPAPVPFSHGPGDPEGKLTKTDPTVYTEMVL